MLLTRRRFMGYIAGFTSTAERWLQLTALLGLTLWSWACKKRIISPLGTLKRYRIVTDLGDIVIGLPIILREQVNESVWLGCYLELPEAALLQLAGESSSEGPTGARRVFLADLRVEVAGVARVLAGRLEPSPGFSLRFSPESLFPRLSQDVPVSCRFGTGLVELTFRPRRLGATDAPLTTTWAKWPGFSLTVRPTHRADTRSRDVASGLEFSRQGDSIGCKLAANNGRSVTFALLRTAGNKTASLELSTGLLGAPAELSWRPGRLTFTQEGKVQAILSLEDEASSPIRSASGVELSFLELVEESGSHFALGSRANRLPFKPTPPTTLDLVSFRLHIGARADREWVLTPSETVLSSEGPPVGFGYDPKDAAPSSLTATHWMAPEDTWKLCQVFSRLGIEARRAAPGGLGLRFTAAMIGSQKVKHSIDNEEREILEISLATAAPQTVLAWSDYLLATTELRNLRLKWGGPKRPKETETPEGKADFMVSAVGWAGRLQSNPGGPSGWVHLSALRNVGAEGDYRPPLAPVGPYSIQWSFSEKSGHSLVFVQHSAIKTLPSAAPAPPTKPFCFGRLFALSDSSFRAGMEAVFPPFAICEAKPGDQTAVGVGQALLLAPFTLREHPNDWVVAGNPAFAVPNMWEPPTIVTIAPAPEERRSIGELFGILQNGCPEGAIRFLNAGIQFAGDVLPLTEASWAPPRPLKGQAPYWAVAVQDMRATNALDLASPASGLVTRIAQGFNEAGEVRNSLLAAVREPAVLVALSPIGGSIDFDWQLERRAQGLRAVGLHSFLTRYQSNGSVLQEVIYPWGLLVEIATRLYRNEDGAVVYLQRWHFVEPEKEYGGARDIRLFNLRPLNGSTWKNDKDPFLFLADVEIREDEQRRLVPDRPLQGSLRPLAGPAVTEAIAFAEVPGFETPRTLFGDTVLRLKFVEWSGPGKPESTPGTKRLVAIEVRATGEVWNPTKGMSLDDPTVKCRYAQDLDIDSGGWIGAGTSDTKFGALVMSLGPGLMRVPNALVFTEVKDPFVKRRQTPQFGTSSRTTAVYELTRTVSLWDVGILQLLQVESPEPDPKKRPDVKGTFRLRYSFDSKNATDAVTVEGSLVFPDLTSLAKPICRKVDSWSFSLAGQPKSFQSNWTSRKDDSGKTRLVTDVGVPGFLVLKDTEFDFRHSDGHLDVKPGNFELCDGLLKTLIDDILQMVLKKLGLGGGSKAFEVKIDFPSIHFTFPGIDLPDVPLGGGTLKGFAFSLRCESRFDFTSSGFSGGFFFVFPFGRFRLPQFGGIDWRGLAISEVGHLMLANLQPVELLFTPFVVRFGGILGFRLKPSKSIDLGDLGSLPDALFNPKNLDLGAFACLVADGGLALAFDVGIAKGSVSVAITVRYCPSITITGNNVQLCLTIIGVGIVIHGEALVAGMINITVHAELIATLQLACSKPSEMICHLVFSGYASVDVWLAKIEFHFTVNLDDVLGLHCCPTPACMAEGRILRPSEERLLASTAQTLKDFYACLECAA